MACCSVCMRRQYAITSGCALKSHTHHAKQRPTARKRFCDEEKDTCVSFRHMSTPNKQACCAHRFNSICNYSYICVCTGSSVEDQNMFCYIACESGLSSNV